MSQWPDNPVIYEVNTACWLRDVGERAGAPGMTLSRVPDHEWDAITPHGIDAVWLMGVWERSPAGRRIAFASPALMESMRHALDDLDDSDLIGSAYCVRRYEADERFGGRGGLAAARRALAERGARLIVDFVPNHVAPDHPWVSEHPEYFVQGSEGDLATPPGGYFRAGETVIACGRDPYFPPWPDVAQLNAFAGPLRRAAADTLLDIATQADGVRCDMAMLMINDVFARTWGDRVGQMPQTEYWSDVIAATRAARPDLLFVAEAYWELEWDLQMLGFDHCYDKRLYDRLVHDDAAAVRAHLGANTAYQRHLLRFTENHDEPRAAAVMAPPKRRAAAIAIATLPGATMWHEGQFDGWTNHVPVFLQRRPAEPVDEDLRLFHSRLLEVAAACRTGSWEMCSATGWPGDDSARHLLAWCWTDADSRRVVIINYSDRPASGRVHLPWADIAGRDWRLADGLTDDVFVRSGDELNDLGLFVSLPAWGTHVLACAADDMTQATAQWRLRPTIPLS